MSLQHRKQRTLGLRCLPSIRLIPPTIHNLPDVYSLSEDQATQLLLIAINVTDPGDAVTCSISSAIPNSTPFTLNSGNELYVKNNPGLSYSTVAQYVLTITCTDGKDPVSSTFTVNLIQNMPPTINNLPATTALHEDHLLEQLLYTLNVTDPEGQTITCSVTAPASSPFFVKPISGTSVVKNPGFIVTDHDTVDTVAYSMDCGAYQAYFTMNPTTGNVTMGAGYDLDTGTNPSSVSCSVVVTDGEFNDTATLLITINQVNDNTPQFSSPTYTFYVSSNDGIGQNQQYDNKSRSNSKIL
ncbi:hypothetical protein KUTeg_005581 [Tegillarca granosa]|uniref:Cadherin domain-containing protein n=1 Tax=Tegillarca granosa TaxID=220873 RepID=A0ABQ9FK36_TEGGR|nr:hypothetical protein KUTeg_005581 [Tegillarca granosa]